MINDLKELVAINSIYDKPEQNAPFGKYCRAALDKFKELAAAKGLKVGEDEGYAAWAEYGEGDKLVGILAHLDIVPAGEGWDTPPFELTERDGVLYGRGVSDDKGPLVACLHAIAELKNEDVELGCRVRLIAGCNEESGSECIKHYVKHCEVPSVSFTPDSDFPVIASEKGIAHFRVILPRSGFLAANIADIRSGDRPNIVPNAAVCRLKPRSVLAERLTERGDKPAADEHTALNSGISVRTENGAATILAAGKAAHGSTPEKGVNAIAVLLSALKAEDESLAAARLLTSPDAADKTGIACEDETGRLTLNVGICDYDDGTISLTTDMRYPASARPDELFDKLLAALPRGTAIEKLHVSPPLAFPEDSPVVRTLMDVYRKVTGDLTSRPLHIGGGTYAKEMPDTIAFGAVFPGRDAHMHEPNECCSVADLKTSERIYREAIIALASSLSRTAR